MSESAYRDAARTQSVSAWDCTIKDKHTKFYCINPECNAVVRLRAIGSVYAPHFYAANHVGWCRTEVSRFKKTQYDETKFNLEKAFNNLSISKDSFEKIRTPPQTRVKYGDGHTRALSKVAQIYSMCKTLRYNDCYNGTEIWHILADNRCNAILTKGINGISLVECFYHRYNAANYQLFFKYPLNRSLPNQYELRLDFSHPKDFWSLNNVLFNKKGFPIVLFGDWHSVGSNCFSCSYISGKQIYEP